MIDMYALLSFSLALDKHTHRPFYTVRNDMASQLIIGYNPTEPLLANGMYHLPVAKMFIDN